MTTTTYDDLAGKVVIVTGANGGMGAAISVALAASGAHVVASDVHDAAGAVLVDAAGNITYRRADVSSSDDVAALVSGTVGDFGRLDSAVNTAAIEFELAPFADCAVEDFDRMMAVNVRGTFLCMKHQINAMLEGGRPGSIVNFASTTSFQPGRRQAAYTTSKHAVLGLTRSAAVDHATDGIRVNAVAPGNIDTPMLRDAVERRGVTMEQVESGMTFGRFGDPSEIANAALFLCSDASSFSTGLTVTVEGGMLLG